MRTMSPSRIILVALLTAAAALPGCGMMVGYKAKGQQTLTAAHRAGSAIHVTTQNGSVQIAADAASRDVVIRAAITASGDSQEEAERRLGLVQVNAQRLPDGTLDISSTFPDGRRSDDSCSLDITLPDASGAVIETSNGAVTLIGLAGDAEVHTSNGSIRVERQQGAVNARTSNGRIAVLHAGDSVDLQTSNGSVELDGYAGSAMVKTSNGKVTCRTDAPSAGPITIHTSNGSITLVVPRSLGGAIEASTSNGGVTVSGADDVRGSKKHRTVRLSGSGATSVLETSNGQVTITIEHADAGSPNR